MQSSISTRSRFLIITMIVLFCLAFVGWFLGGKLIAPKSPGNGTNGGSQGNAPAPHFAPETRIALPRAATNAVKGKRANFESGVVLPEWQPDGYSISSYQTGLQQISAQAGARWIEMPVIFFQSSDTSTQVTTAYSTESVDAVAQGIRTARALGFHVFLNPLLQVQNVSDDWAGRINFSTYQQEQAWFASYWQVFKPYVETAAQNGADQIAIGTEYQWLQQNAPASLWNQLIANIHSVFPGSLTYDLNWEQQVPPLTSWMKNPLLTTLGISEYISLVSSSTRVDPSVMPALWAQKVKPVIDGLAAELGKPVLITEIGYRNSSDALYTPFLTTSSTPADPVEQAGAYNAALTNVIPDPDIEGIFFWGWENVQGLQPSPAAVEVLHKWYTSPQI
jgi:hypothetical protein